MKKQVRLQVIVLLISLASAPITGQEFQDFYTDFFEYLDLLESKNIGLTSFPLLNIPLGGAREAIGTAYTALSENSGYIDANPAASSLLTNTELSIFHNNLIADVSLESVVYTIKLNRLGLGAAGKFLHVPFTRYDSRGNQLASKTFSENIIILNVSYLLFPTFYFSGLAVGANIKIAYRSIPSDLYTSLPLVVSNSQDGLGIMGDFGFQGQFNLLKFYSAREKNFFFGGVIQNIGPPVNGDPLPTQFTAGIAYKPLRFLLLSSDILVPINLVDIDASESIGVAAGIGVQFTNFLTLRSGLLLKGQNPRISAGFEIVLPWTTFYLNYVLDRTTKVGTIDRFSVQVALNLGDRGRSEIQSQVDSLYLEALQAFAESNYPLVIELCEQALELDPSFTPALRTLKTARESYELDRALEEIRVGTEGQGSSEAAQDNQ
jgi:hypothetical protein